MADRKRGCAWLLLMGVGSLIALFVVFLLSLSRILDLDLVKQRLIALALEQLGARLGYEKVDLSLFPRPRIVIRQGSVTWAGEVEISLEKLTAETSLLPLLKGDFELAKIRVEAPTLKLQLSEEGGGDPDLSVQAEIREQVASVVPMLVSTMPGLAALLEGGTLELRREDRRVFRLEGLRGRIDVESDNVLVDLSCRSEFWDSLSLKSSVSSTVKGEGRIRLRGIEIAGLLEGLVPSTLTQLEAADFDLEIGFDGHVPDLFEGEFRGSLPSLRTQTPDPGKIAEGLQFGGAFRLEGRRMSLSLDRLALEYPRLQAKANLSVDPVSPQVSLEAEGEGIDLLELRELALMTGGENPLVQEICGYVRGGEVSSLVVRSQGASFSDLGRLENLSVQGRFRNARIVVPDPGLEIEGLGGEIALSPGLIEGKDLIGRLGRSSFSGTAVRLDLRKALYVQHLSGDLTVSLDEIYQKLVSWKEFREVTKELKTVRGIMALRVKSLSGPLEKPDQWRFQAGGTLKRILVGMSLLPGLVNIPRGSFQVNRESIRLEGVRANLLDAQCVVSGRLDGYREGLRGMEWTLNGQVGPEINRWMSEQFELPPEYLLRAPYELSHAVFKWEKGKDSLVSGALLSPPGPRVSVDLVLKPETVVVNELSIEDGGSKASFGLKEMGDAFSLTFRGDLEKDTLDDLLLWNRVLSGRIEGNLEAKICIDRPMDSRATGTLRTEGLRLPLPLPVPVILEAISVRAQENRIRLERAELTWDEQKFVLEGDTSFSSEGFLLDMDVRAGDLEWSKIQEAMGDQQKEADALPQADSGDKGGLDNLTIGGVMRINADSFTFEQFTWRPMAVEIRLQGEHLEIQLKEADLCGVSTAGTVKLLPDELFLDLEILSQKKRIEDVIDCIQSDVKATGDIDFKAKLTGTGQAETTLRWLEGDFELSCRKGTILQDPLLSAILAFLNTTEILRGKLPDYRTQGFPYNSIQARGVLREGILKLEEVVIDGTTVDIYAVGAIDMVERRLNVRVLVSSLQTVEFIFSKIPLLSYLLGKGGLTAIPLRLRGSLDNPMTVPLSPMALGEDLVGIMGRTLGLPYAVVKWLLPKKEKQAEVQ